MNVRDVEDKGKTQKEEFSEETINIFFFLQVKVEITCESKTEEYNPGPYS